MNTTRTTHGLSLVELLIALAIGVLLVAGIIQLVVNHKATYKRQASLNRLQENGRFARYHLQHQLRMAGYLGCRRSAVTTPTNLISSPTETEQWTADNPVHGFDGKSDTWKPAVTTWIKQRLPDGTALVKGSDILSLRNFNPALTHLDQPLSTPNDPLAVSITPAIKAGEILYIDDCQLTDIFRASDATTATEIHHAASKNTTAALSTAYTTAAVIGRVSTTTYYVRSSAQKNNYGNTVNVLVSQDLNGNETVLIAGIDTMQITYGVDTDGDRVADNFFTADEVEERQAWARVMSIHIALLLNSIDAVGKPVERYAFQGTTHTGRDGVLRRQWDITVALRNRIV
jgi:type IV pilus assembly protein PilW